MFASSMSLAELKGEINNFGVNLVALCRITPAIVYRHLSSQLMTFFANKHAVLGGCSTAFSQYIAYFFINKRALCTVEWLYQSSYYCIKYSRQTPINSPVAL